MYITLKRNTQSGDGIYGNLLVDGKPFCSTIERTSKAIPALIYRVGVTHSQKFNRLLPILKCVPGREGIRIHGGTRPSHSPILKCVPGREGIRIHGGTRPSHSQGCILLPPGYTDKLTQLLLQAEQNKETNLIDIQPL